MDIYDIRRKSIYADATCGDCDSWLTPHHCEMANVLVQSARDALKEAAPDFLIPGIVIAPTRGEKANLCPQFAPSFEYMERKEAEEEQEWRETEDANRMHSAVSAAKGYAAW